MLETKNHEQLSKEVLRVLAAVDSSTQKLLEQALSEETVVFENGGVQELLKSGPNSSLLVIDLELFSGAALGLAKIRESQHFENIPLLVLSKEFEASYASLFVKGFVDFIRKPIHLDELHIRLKNLLRQQRSAEVRSKREEDLYEMTLILRELNKELDRLSHYDALTNLPNRRLFLDVMEKEWRRAVREKTPISVLMIDIDHFKNYNDTYGHLEGDDLLQQIAICLRTNLRRPGDLAARWGGEEFVVVLPRTDKRGALTVAEAMRTAVEKLKLENQIDSEKMSVSVSIGVASAEPRVEQKFMELIDKADSKLYLAKDEGRNCVRA